MNIWLEMVSQLGLEPRALALKERRCACTASKGRFREWIYETASLLDVMESGRWTESCSPFYYFRYSIFATNRPEKIGLRLSSLSAPRETALCRSAYAHSRQQPARAEASPPWLESL